MGGPSMQALKKGSSPNSGERPAGPLSFWERVRVKATALAIQGLVSVTAHALTPALSQGERGPSGRFPEIGWRIVPTVS
jgi:hypothetical protein